MANTLNRQLNDADKAIILERFGRTCFATGHPIAENEKLQFDHIRAFALGGQSELDNIAPMCEHHNKAKGMLSLEDFRIKLQIEDFFKEDKKGEKEEKKESERLTLKNQLTLKNLLKYLKKHQLISSYGESISQTTDTVSVQIESHSYKATFQLQKCPLTGWDYFYGILPISILDSDDEDEKSIGLQPRYLIFDKVFGLFRHFQVYPVLQPSIGRIKDGKIVLFDGQHKVAALLWTDRKEFECKIYINPDIRLLNQTNIAAHDTFAQTRFFSAILIQKLGQQFGKDFDDYKNLDDSQEKTESKDSPKKTEVGFLEYLERVQDTTMKRVDRTKRFRSYLYNSILDDEGNKLKPLVSSANRSSKEQPLTVDMLSKSIFACFLYTEPVEDDMTDPKCYRRELEFNNNVKLLNILFELALYNWNPKASPNDMGQLKLTRVFSSKCIMAWSEIVRDAICAKLDIIDGDDRAKAFYRELSDQDFSKIRTIIERLLNWSMWMMARNSEIDNIIATNKSNLKDWFKSKGLTTGYLMGAKE